MIQRAAGTTPPERQAPTDRAPPRVRTVTRRDVAASLAAGFADFKARPVMSGFFGLFYALFGVLFVWVLGWLGKVWMILPAAVGFPLVAPFAAAGLYEMSRRMQQGKPFGWGEVLTVMADQRRREMGWMAFVTLFVFWVWMYQIRLWLALILQDSSFSDMAGFLGILFFTTQGWTFLAIGTAIGACLSAVLFSVTVVAMPMLLERDDVDFVTAMLTSVRVVAENPGVMLGWAMIVSLVMFVSMVPAFLGLIVTLPILGHTTWHLYRHAVEPRDG